MQYKLIVTDLDDTLLRPDYTIGPRSIAALQKAVDKGMFFAVATGRMYVSTKQFLDKLPVNMPVIVYNGALILDHHTGEKIYHKPVPLALAMEILDLAAEWGAYAHVYLDNAYYMPEHCAESEIYKKQTTTEGTPVHMDLRQFLKTDPTKVLLIMPPEKVSRLRPLMKEKYQGKLVVVVSKPEYLEFLNVEAGKENALRFLAEKHEIKREEIIAFGDSYNDIGMLQYAGRGIAVANAHEAVKESADQICPSNGEDGVAQILEELL